MITLYMGPIRVEPKIKLIGGLFALVDKDCAVPILGYPQRSRGFVFISYDITNLPAITQAIIRSKKNWSSLLIWQDTQERWKGKINYDNSTNTIESVIMR